MTSNKGRAAELTKIRSEFSRYLVAGGLAFVCDFSLLYVCTDWFGIHYLQSNVIGYAGGFMIAYLLNTKWVFQYRRYTNVGQEVAIFLLIALIGILLSELVLYVLVEGAALNYLLAKIFATGVVFLFNFIARKYFLFSKQPGRSREPIEEGA